MTPETKYRLKNLKAYFDALKVGVGVHFARQCNLLTFGSRLEGVLCQRVGDSAWNGGRMVNLGLLGCRVVTNAGVAYLVDDWAGGTTEISNMNFHDSGTGTTAEAAAQTDLITPAGPTTRATGTLTQPSSNVVQSVGTIAYTGTLAITEHGLFSQAARGGGTMWDRTLFSAINVVNGDSIQFTYQCTLTAGS